MYIERVRSYIRDLYKNDKKKYNLFIEKLTKILQTKYRKKNIKQSEVKRRVTEFLEGTQPKAEYFEAYLHAIDEISLNGAIEVLKGKEIKEPSNWREFLILSVEKKPLPKNIAQHFKDPDILEEVKRLIYLSITYCADTEKKKFQMKLHDFNRFLNIKNDI